MVKKYYCIRQHDITDCGAACLATISKQYGLKIPITKIREIAGTDKQGTNAYGVIKAANKLGFTAKGVKGDKEAFFSDFPLPCIAHVVMEGGLQHYIVIHKITKEKVIVADPGKGLVTYTPEDFFKIWTGVLIFLVPDETFKKGNESEGIFFRFFHLLIPQWKLILNIFLTSIVFTVFGIGASFYFQFLIDDILPNQLEDTLFVLSIGIIVLHSFRMILNFFRSHLLLYLSQKLDLSLIFSYYTHVLKLPVNFFGTRKVGEIISRFNDASKVRDAIASATLTVMIDTLMAIFGAFILYSQNAMLFGITVILAIFYGVIVFAFNKPLKKVNEKIMEDNAQLTSYMVESLNGIETLKAFNYEEKIVIKSEQKFIRLLKSVFKGGLLSNVQSALSETVAVIGGVVILWVGATSVMSGDLSVGELLAFNALLAYFLDPIKNLINLQPMMQTAIVASDRLGEILDLELEKDFNEDKKAKPDLSGTILFKNIDFRYGTRKTIIEDLTINIEKGEKIALVGESGSGKTTLAKLLLNFYQVEKGEITINDYNLLDIDMNYLREKIAYVQQETFLFSGTILENLRYGQEDLAMEDIIEVCKLSKAHDFINEMPLRYETRLEENGSNLSGGQRQRLAIARAMLKKPDILILDEATSNLDSITEKAIENTINEFSDKITTIIIAHRLSTIMRCDKIYVLDKGKVIESGSHFELMDKKDIYYKLWKEQIPVTESKKNEVVAELAGDK